MVEFSASLGQAVKAAERYETMADTKADRRYKRINLIMDLTAADGVNGNSHLDWDRLLAADDFNFMHDLSGICRHMNRETGELGNCFVPRFTRKQVEAA